MGLVRERLPPGVAALAIAERRSVERDPAAMSPFTEYAVPALYALFVWWFSTGLILYLDGLPRWTFRWTLLAATGLAACAFLGLAQSSGDATRSGAYVAFTCSILVWAWNEIAFLMGFVTGPRATPCSPGCGGWRHFRHGAETVIHHELALVASGMAVAAVTWGGPNQLAVWTFFALWGMRLSTKLNVFLGVPNVAEEFLPEHLDHLKHFFRKRAMNPLFPVSVTLSTVLVVLVARSAFRAEATSFEAVAQSFVAALLALGLVEHWFLVVPLPASSLWGWGLRSRDDSHAPRSPGRLVLDGGLDQSRSLLEQEIAKGRGDR